MFSSEKLLFGQIFSSFQKQLPVIVAVDEVGRGCVAGPVLTCASLWVMLDNNNFSQPWTSLVKDSKKLTSAKRSVCYHKVLEHFNFTSETLPVVNSTTHTHIPLKKSKAVLSFQPNSSEGTKFENMKCVGFCLGEGSIGEVEQFNIWNAVQIAAGRALLGLKEQFIESLGIQMNKIVLLVDGHQPFAVPNLFADVIQATAIKGDDLFVSIGLSSILAKVYRDLFMEKQEVRFPQYGFAKHKGYGTALHLENIVKHGACELHRFSFLKKYIL